MSKLMLRMITVCTIICGLASCMSTTPQPIGPATTDVEDTTSLEDVSECPAKEGIAKGICSIDADFLKEEENCAGSTGEMVVLYNKYYVLWQQEFDQYDKSIRQELESIDEELVNEYDVYLKTLSDMMAQERELVGKIDSHVYAGGSILGPLEAQAIMEIQRYGTIRLSTLYARVIEN